MASSAKDSAQVIVFSELNLAKLLQSGWDMKKLVSGKIGTLTSRRRVFDLKATATVLSVKHLVEDGEGLPVEEMTLMDISGTILTDGQTLKEAGIVGVDFGASRGVMLLSSSILDQAGCSGGDVDQQSGGMMMRGSRDPSSGSETMVVDGEDGAAEGEGRGDAGSTATGQDGAGPDWWAKKGTISGPQGGKKGGKGGGAAAAAGAGASTAASSGLPLERSFSGSGFSLGRAAAGASSRGTVRGSCAGGPNSSGGGPPNNTAPSADERRRQMADAALRRLG